MSDSANPAFAIADRVPPEVELCEIGLSFTLKQGKNLSQTWSRELRTECDSLVTLRVSEGRLELSCTPPILIDAQWPARNMTLGGAAVRFADARIEVFVAGVHGVGEGLVDFTADAQKEIRALITTGLTGTAMASPGYNPMRDAAVLATLQAIGANFQKQPSSGKSDVSMADLGNLSVEATLALRAPFTHESGGAGLSLPSGATLHVRVASAGNVAGVAGAGSAEASLRAANIQSITLTSDALSIISGGSPVALLKRARIERGGVVKVEQLRLQGSLEDAAGVESLLRVFAGAVSLAAHGVNPAAGVRIAAASSDARAQIVPGLTQAKIEEALTHAVQALLRDHANALPGINLRDIGIA